MAPLSPELLAVAIRAAWTNVETYGARNYVARQYVDEHLPIRGRRVWIAQAHIMRAWTPAEIVGSDDIEAYVVNAHAGRMN